MGWAVAIGEIPVFQAGTLKRYKRCDTANASPWTSEPELLMSFALDGAGLKANRSEPIAAIASRLEISFGRTNRGLIPSAVPKSFVSVRAELYQLTR